MFSQIGQQQQHTMPIALIYNSTEHYVKYNTNTKKKEYLLNGVYQDNLDLFLIIMLVNTPDASYLHLYPIYFY